VQNLAIALILAGLSVPALAVAWHGARDLESTRALRHLWKTLVTAVPDVSAGSVQHGPTAVFTPPRILLIRRVSEIRDAALALRCYVNPDAVAAVRSRLKASGISGQALDAASEACWLEMAVRAVTSGASAEHPTHVLPGGDGLLDEVKWLRQVAMAARAGIAAAVAAEFTEGTVPH
jgi:hypothetical protein